MTDTQSDAISKPLLSQVWGKHKLNITWAILMIVTLLNALVAETAEPHLAITFIICFQNSDDAASAFVFPLTPPAPFTQRGPITFVYSLNFSFNRGA